MEAGESVPKAEKSIWPEQVKVEVLAELLCLSERRIYDLARRGIVVRAPERGMFEFLPSMHGYIEFKRREAAEVGAPSPLRQERIESVKVDRQIQELKLERMRAEHIAIDEIDVVWADFAARIKKTVLALPRAFMDALPHLTPHDEKHFRTMALDILDGLAEEADASVIGADPELLKPTPAERAGIPRRRNRR